MVKRDFSQRIQELNSDRERLIAESNATITEMQRVIDITENTDSILTDIDKKFEEQTKLTNAKDISFLFLATGLLCTKWIVMKTLVPLEVDFSHKLKPSKDRLNSTELGDIDSKGKSVDAYKKTLDRVKKIMKKVLIN